MSRYAGDLAGTCQIAVSPLRAADPAPVAVLTPTPAPTALVSPGALAAPAFPAVPAPVQTARKTSSWPHIPCVDLESAGLTAEPQRPARVPESPMSPPSTDRIFTSGDLPLLSLPCADGLIICRWLPDPVVTRTWGPSGSDSRLERRRAQVGFDIVEPSWLVRAAAERVQSPGVDAVVIHAQGGLPGRSALALAFASHLRSELLRAGRPARVVASGARPDLTGLNDLVRVPHLVTVTDATGAIADTIVWEVVTASQFDIWLDGAPRPDQRAIEAQLPGLLRLRGLHRAGRLDRRRAAALLDVMDSGEGVTISTELIHRYPGVILPLAASTAAA